jgi:hypothetical protein
MEATVDQKNNFNKEKLSEFRKAQERFYLYEMKKVQDKKKVQLYSSSFLVFSMTATAILLYLAAKEQIILANEKYLVILMGFTSMIGVATYLYKSLIFNNSGQKISNDIKLKKLEQEIIELKKKRYNFKLEDEDIDNIYEKAISNLDNRIISKLECKIQKNNEDTLFDKFHKLSESTTTRLKKELESLKMRASTNLGIGSFIAVLGIVILVVLIMINGNSTNTINNVIPFFISFLPKLSIVLVVEFFSFFFLKLYKENLKEIKYYQNELTNVECIMMSTKLGILLENDSMISVSSNRLVNTERNFILKKDETTVEIEKQRLDKVEYKEWLESISKIIGKGK